MRSALLNHYMRIDILKDNSLNFASKFNIERKKLRNNYELLFPI